MFKIPWGALDPCGLVILGSSLDSTVCDHSSAAGEGWWEMGVGGFSIFLKIISYNHG